MYILNVPSNISLRPQPEALHVFLLEHSAGYQSHSFHTDVLFVPLSVFDRTYIVFGAKPLNVRTPFYVECAQAESPFVLSLEKVLDRILVSTYLEFWRLLQHV